VRLITPEAIRTLQRKLYQKAKREPGYRFYALYDKVYRADVLAYAYRLVKAAGGCAGADGRTFADIEGEEGIAEFLMQNNIFACGRYGSWRYMSMEDVLLEGRQIAAKIASLS